VGISSKETGIEGEGLAINFLKRNGYRILQKNYRCKCGEIDIIAKDGSTICFVEVKTRRTETFGLPADSVTPAKQNKISRTAQWYMRAHSLLDCNCRFDVVTVMLTPPNRDKNIRLIKNAFEIKRVCG
jgi:putative endonuclease